MKKVGFDIHGLINKNPKLFSAIIKDLKQLGYEIHILTGASIDNSIIKELKGYGIEYDVLFSISDFHKRKGTHMWENDDGWWLDDDEWNRTKGDYCEREGISVCIDDTEVYGDYFTTPFAYMTNFRKVPRKLFIYDDIEEEILKILSKYSGIYYKIKFK